MKNFFGVEDYQIAPEWKIDPLKNANKDSAAILGVVAALSSRRSELEQAAPDKQAVPIKQEAKTPTDDSLTPSLVIIGLFIGVIVWLVNYCLSK